MLVEVLVGHAAQLVEDASDFDTIISVRVSSSFGGDQEPLGAFACLPDVGRVVVDVSEHEAGFSPGNSSIRCGAISLSAVLAGVSLAESGIQTPQPAMARCSFYPYTHPCQPLLVQPASVSMEVWGTMPASLSFLCHTPRFARKVVLSRATALPTLPRPKQFHQVASQAADLLRQRVRQ